MRRRDSCVARGWYALRGGRVALRCPIALLVVVAGRSTKAVRLVLSRRPRKGGQLWGERERRGEGGTLLSVKLRVSTHSVESGVDVWVVGDIVAHFELLRERFEGGRKTYNFF